MRIGILGSGLMGGRLGRIYAQAGHEVVFSYARTQAKLDELAREAGNGARAGSPAEAVRDADVVLLAVHWTRVEDVLAQAGDLSGKLVLTCSLAMSADDSHLVIGHTSSGPEALAEKLPGARIVAAYNTVPGEILFPVFERRGSDWQRPDLIYAGDDAQAKATVAGLIRDSGFNPVDLGDLRTARYMEPFGLAISVLAYGGREGPELGYRFMRMHERA